MPTKSFSYKFEGADVEITVKTPNPKKIVVGDMVRLLSGSIPMTVNSINEDDVSIWCTWYDFNAGKFDTRCFNRKALIHFPQK